MFLQVFDEMRDKGTEGYLSKVELFLATEACFLMVLKTLH